MPRTINETPITTPNARRKLGAGEYWRRIDQNVHLGYRRRGRRGGRWVVRWRIDRTETAETAAEGTERAYLKKTIGTADDALRADGVIVFTFDQAVRRAGEIVEQWYAEAAKSKANVEVPEEPPVTVRQAIEEYLKERDKREELVRGINEKRFLQRDARNRLTNHVLQGDSTIADKALEELSEHDLMDWREGLKLAAATKQRLVNDFRAALNRATVRYRSRLPAEIAVTIKHGLRSTEPLGVVARAIQVLSDAEVRRIIKAAQELDAEKADWNGDLYRLVLALAATGMRFSQLIRLTVADVQPERNRLMIPTSRKGNGTKATRVAVPVGEDVITALRPAMAGRKGSEALLIRPKWKQTGADRWQIIGREPWHVASELLRPWAAILRRAGLSGDVIPYSLRHSSIVRAIRSGLPIRLVAALHDTSVAIIEKHYAAFITDALDELAAGAVVPLAPTESTAEVARLPIRPRSN
jgi:integrase